MSDRPTRQTTDMLTADDHAHPAIIVKVQVPLFSAGVGHSRALALVYDQQRQHMVEQPIDKRTRTALGRDAKGYFEGAWDGVHKQWTFGKMVTPQPW